MKGDTRRNRRAASYADEYRALLAVSDVLISHADPSALVHDVAARLHEVMEFEFLALALYDPAADTIRLCAQSSDHSPPPTGATFPLEDSPPGWVWRTQRALIVPNVAEETRWPWFLERMPRTYGINSFCELPLTTVRGPLGTLAFGSNRVSSYDSTDVQFMQRVANQVALAVENARAFHEIAELRDRLEREPLLPLHEAVSAFKRKLVERALAARGGNRSRAAAALRIERTSLLRLIRELGIEGLPPGQRGRPLSARKPASFTGSASRKS